ncbi:MAG: hypothetical protein ACKO6L_05085 [Flavobacteriales bacterium]
MAFGSSRLLGIDVAYTIAIVGCVISGFYFTMSEKLLTLDRAKYHYFFDFFPALFFFLNGFTVTLTMRDRRISSRKLLTYLSKRGAILMLFGGITLYMWPMNIFFASGFMFVIAPFTAQWNSNLLRIIALLGVILAMSLFYLGVPAHATYALPDLARGEMLGVAGFLLLNGYFSPLPWLLFFFMGLLYGREEIRPRGILPPSSILGIGLVIAAFFVQRFSKKIITNTSPDAGLIHFRMLLPAFVFYATGLSLILMNAVIFIFRKVRIEAIVRFVQTISSSKYSAILFQTLLGVLTISASNVQIFSKRFVLPLYVVTATVLTFVLVFIWRKRINTVGPMEWVIKRISGSSKK